MFCLLLSLHCAHETWLLQSVYQSWAHQLSATFYDKDPDKLSYFSESAIDSISIRRKRDPKSIAWLLIPLKVDEQQLHDKYISAYDAKVLSANQEL